MSAAGLTPSRLDGGRTCLLITGAPGAGKTTVANRVARSLSRSAMINCDAIARLVVGGYVWPLGDPPHEAARQVALCNANICSLANNFIDAGFTPVIDWIVPDADQLDVYPCPAGFTAPARGPGPGRPDVRRAQPPATAHRAVRLRGARPTPCGYVGRLRIPRLVARLVEPRRRAHHSPDRSRGL